MTTETAAPPVTHELAVVDGLRLHYVTAGLEGNVPTVVLWHGFLGSWYSWRALIPLLAERFRVVAFDMRGYGDSDKPATGYDAATLAADATGLLDHLGVDDAVIVAHDMGAPPALALTAEYPDRVRALVWLEEPVPGPGLREALSFTREHATRGGLWWFWFNQTDLAELLVAGRERQFLSWFYRAYSYDPTAIGEADVAEYARTFAAAGGIRGALGVYRAIFDTEDQLAPLTTDKITTPVLAVGGELSLGDGAAQMMRTVATSVHGATLARCGHFLAEERPHELAHEILAFLDAVLPH